MDESILIDKLNAETYIKVHYYSIMALLVMKDIPSATSKCDSSTCIIYIRVYVCILE